MQIEQDQRHRMPVFFGPAPGPRQMPAGRADPKNSPRRTLISLVCRADASGLEPLLPSGFSLWGEPRLVFEAQRLAEIDWLAGRGYDTFGVKIPVRYEKGDGPMYGHLLTVLFENLPDPIITGREELGFAKLYCEIDFPRLADDALEVACSWLGFEFFRLEAEGLAPATEAQGSGGQAPQGVFHFRYFPRVGEPGKSDVAQITFTPAANPDARVLGRRSGHGRARFRRGSWEDLPTLHYLVDRLAGLALEDSGQLTVVESVGGKDLSDTVCLTR